MNAKGGGSSFDSLPPWPCADDAVRQALEQAYADGSWGRYHGPHCQRLVEQLAAMHDVEFAALTCSGTFAVELALRAAKVGPGDEVILAAYDFPGNFRSIEAIDARPVLVDIVPRTWCLDAAQLSVAISKATRAILVSHLHGGLADMPSITAFAAQHGLAVIEDACQAAGASLAGRIAGSWGDVGVLSFGGSKLLTAGRGGAIVTRHAEFHQRAKVFCERGNDAFPLSELQAAVLLPQLEKLAERNALRRENVVRLLAATGQVAGLRPPQNFVAEAAASYYKLAWLYDPSALGGTEIGRLVDAAQAAGLPLDRGFRGFVQRTERRCRKIGELPNARRAAEATLLLHHPVLLEPAARIDHLGRVLADMINS